MRWKISPKHWPGNRDARQIDLIAIATLLIVIVAAWRYLDDSTALPPSSTAFIVPSQSTHW